MHGRRMRFGRTWWGAAWLQALEKLGSAYWNRLPRGRTYARKGAVLDIKIKNGKVEASVQGRQPSPYRVTISLSHLTRRQITQLMDLIHSDPLISAQLLANEMPKELEKILTSRQSGILPQQPEEFTLHCSCPDWAVPCKHICAVFYVLANEIDKNPLILFQLRGVESEQLFGKRKPREKPFPNKNGKISTCALELVEKPTTGDLHRLDELALRPREDVSSLIFMLLPKEQLFHSFDFHSFLKKLHSKVKKKVLALETMNTPMEIDERWRFCDVRVLFPQDLQGEIMISFTSRILKNAELTELLSQSLNITIKKGARKDCFTLPFKIIEPYLLRIPLSADVSPSMKQLIYITHFAHALLQTGHFIPSVKDLQHDQFVIRYRPLYLSEDSRKIRNALITAIDEKIFKLGKRHVSRTSAVNGILEDIVSRTVKHVAEEMSDLALRDDELITAFIKDVPYVADRFEKANMSTAIKKWLSAFELVNASIHPALQVLPPRSQRAKKWRLRLFIQEQSGFTPIKECLHDETVQRIIYTLSTHYPTLKDFLRKKEEVTISMEELSTLVHAKRPLLSLLGLLLIFPKKVITDLKPVLTLGEIKKKRKSSSASDGMGLLSLDDIINAELTINIGSETITLEEFKKLLASGRQAVKFRDKWVLLRPEQVESLLAAEKEFSKGMTLKNAIKLTLLETIDHESIHIKINPNHLIKEMVHRLKNPEDIKVPASFKGKLRQYQLKGFRWMVTNLELAFSPCLADDMGLGKTIQAIATILYFKEAERQQKRRMKPTLIVCPTSVLGNWQRELKRFSPMLKVRLYHGPERFLDAMDSIDVLLTSYALVRMDFEQLSRIEWDIIILDEAQYIKNPQAQVTLAVKNLKATRKIALTGTPIENRLLELWSIMDFLNPGFLGTRRQFIEQFARPIERYADQQKTEQLKRIISPFILRRLKTDKEIAAELPDKVEIPWYCELTPQQVALYTQAVENALSLIEKSEGMKRRGNILKLITHLKQICNHPSHFLKKKTITFESSGKIQALKEILCSIINRREKVLIFTQYREMADLLKKAIQKEFHVNVALFSGNVTRKKREEILNKFSLGYIDVLILTLKAGGFGLNLTQANNVIHYDLWWNPAVEQQAADRTYRIGQDKNVFVYRLITRGTIEEKIDELLQRKKELSDSILSTGEQWITELSNEELRQLVTLSSY